MAQTIKILGQSNPSAATQTNLYEVPTSTSTIVSTVNVCNRSATATTFRVAVGPTAASVGDSHYLYYDMPIAGNDTFQFTCGMTMEAGKFISVYATLATLTFQAFGQEIT